MIAEKPESKRAAYGLPPDMQAVLRSTQELQSFFLNGFRQDGSYKPETINAVLRYKRVNVAALAGLHGYSDVYFWRVINREKKDVKVENIIAERLGIDPDRMWGRRLLEAAHAC